MKIINIVARLLTSALAIWTGLRIIMLGLAVSTIGGFSRSLPVLAVAFVFLGPAMYTLFGGSMKLIRGLWILVAALSLAALLYPPARLAGMAMLIYAILGLVISLGARDKKTEEEIDVHEFS